MNIRNTRELRAFAAQRVAVSPSQKQILLIYAGIVLGLAALPLSIISSTCRLTSTAVCVTWADALCCLPFSFFCPLA